MELPSLGVRTDEMIRTQDIWIQKERVIRTVLISGRSFERACIFVLVCVFVQRIVNLHTVLFSRDNNRCCQYVRTD